jgi:hypothetical protein
MTVAGTVEVGVWVEGEDVTVPVTMLVTVLVTVLVMVAADVTVSVLVPEQALIKLKPPSAAPPAASPAFFRNSRRDNFLLISCLRVMVIL